MVFYKRCFELIAVGLNRVVDVLHPVAAEGTGAGYFMDTVGKVKVCVYEDSPKVHNPVLICRLRAVSLKMVIILINSTPLAQINAS